MASEHLLEHMVEHIDPSAGPSVDPSPMYHSGTRGSATVGLGVVPGWDDPSATVGHKPLDHPLAQPSIDPAGASESLPPVDNFGVWVEHPGDDGSAVWGCSSCERGAWCWDHTSARLEATMHARTHGTQTRVKTLNRPHGPKVNAKRDVKIASLRADGLSARAIAAAVKMSHSGVLKALRRLTAKASQ